MSVGGRQRVVIIQDASRDVNPGTIRLILQQFSLKAADVLILYGALHQVTNPMGYKIKVDSSSVFGLNPKLVADEVSRKKLDYSNNEEIITISKLCQLEQIEFRVEVHAGPTPKVIAMKAAKTLKPTWLILDRQMKKDQAYFTEKLSCGISRIKRDNTIEELRQPKPKMAPKPKAAEKGSEDNTRSGQVTYDEMIPGSPENGKEEEGRSRSRKKSVLGMSSIDEPSTPPVTSTTARLFYESSCSGTTGPTRVSADPEEEEKSTLAEREAANNAKPPVSPSEIQEEEVTEDSSPKVEEPFRNSICSICNNERPKTEWKRDFTYSELHSATEGFSVKNFLSEGGFGSVYKGDINGMKVAVKQHKSASLQGEKEFKAEVMVLKRVRHENLVTLLGSCAEGSHRLLVYEYVCNGSLDQHLSKHTRKPLSWEMRMKIAIGAAKGLQYLHENNIIHRDMRPSNILITHDYEAMLGDFGLARTQQEDQELSTETNVVGTLGYLAPEYAEYGKVSTKTDVYSFGIVLLQLITGLKTTDKKLGGKSLVGWARPLLKDKNYPDLIDQRILDTHDVHQLFWMVRVAEKCLSKDPSDTISSTRGSSEDDYTGGSSVSTSGTSSVASLPLFLPPLLQSCTSIRNPPTPPMETTCAAPTQQQYESWYEI